MLIKLIIFLPQAAPGLVQTDENSVILCISRQTLGNKIKQIC